MNFEEPERNPSFDINSSVSSDIVPNLIDFSDVVRSPLSLIDLGSEHSIEISNINENCNPESTQNTTFKPKGSWVDILLGLNNEDNIAAGTQPVLLSEPSTSNSNGKSLSKKMVCYASHPKAVLPKKSKKSVPDLLPIKRNFQIDRRRPSITARYLIATIEEINSKVRQENEENAIEEKAEEEEITVSIITDDEEFGKLHYSDSE